LRPREFYPDLEQYSTWFLDTGNNRELYVEEWGSPAGKLVAFLHGARAAAPIPRTDVHSISRLHINSDAGHSMAELGITDALITATNRFASGGR
jgi:hypothetical protein